jgi:hypothetical protein
VAREDAIREFWSWWETAVQAVDTSGQRELPALLVSELRDRVHAIDPALVWDIGPLGPGQTILTVSAGGDPELFATAARWKAAAPADGETWRYSSVRLPRADVPSGTLRLHGRALAIAEARYKLDARRDDDLVDLRFHHPALRRVPDAERLEAAFLILDAVLGEVAVERHLGVIEWGRVRYGGLDAVGLRSGIADLEEARLERLAAGASSWAFLERELEGSRQVVTVNTSLRQVDHPLLDTRAEVRLRIAQPTPNGFATDGEAEHLYKVQAALLSGLGEDAVLTSRETHAGVRTLVLAIDGQSRAPATLERVRSANPSLAIELVLQPDPGWQQVKQRIELAR